MTGPVKLIVIDSFCGAGGVTEGFHRAKVNGEYCVVVVIGINHDALAIESHAQNHLETQSFVEDFRTLDPHKLVGIVEKAKRQNPGAKVLFQMSAECTHHSKAKGGESRDADSRSLPEHLYRYIDVLKPDIITVENVVEFLDWGPLQIKVIRDKKGNDLYSPLEFKKDKKTKKVLSVGPKWVPVQERKGEYFELWKESIESYGYHYDYRKLNAANYGAFTSRTRYFGIFSFAKKNIAFPVATHSKDGKNGLRRWNAVKDVLNLKDEGISIFDRPKELVEATFGRIYAGLLKFVDKEPVFISKCFSGHPESKNISTKGPAGAITTKDHHSLINCKFIQTYYGNGGTTTVDQPCPTITTKDRCALVDAKFITNSYNGGGKTASIESPCPSVMTVPKQNLTTCHFIDQQFGQSKPASVLCPVGALTANPKYSLVSPQRWLLDTNFKNVGSALQDPSPVITANRKYHYLVNPQFESAGWSIERPCFTLIARMDKRPPGMVTAKSDFNSLPSFIKVEGNTLIYHIFDTDSPMMVSIKEFMAAHGITDILMRMLRIDELLRIMGFGDHYVLRGTQTDKKKFIGNAVECTQAQVLAEAIAATI